MCGIAGYFSGNNFVSNKKKIQSVKKIMQYRGPDGHGVYDIKNSKKYFLKIFHSRLSIIDPHVRSNQPLQDEKGIIVFNGMIYNFIEIRNRLKQRGIKFKTYSDTEVLLKFLNYEGIDKIDELEGMWSFAYYDFTKKKLYISRDRFGEKPLYFYKDKTSFVFGSSIDYILKITNYKFKLDKKQIEIYIKNGFRSLFHDPNLKSFFKNIYSFPSGKYFEIDQKFKISKKNYWDPKKLKINLKKQFTTEVKNLKQTYSEVVNDRVYADFPVACLLSGGIDSSSIACNISKNKNKNIHYFSAYSSDKNYDESDLINRIVKKKKLSHSYVKVKKDNVKNLDLISDIIKKTGNLVPTVSWLLYSYICKEIKKKKFKVVLTGTGGDEIFAGYYAHHLHFLQSVKLKKNMKDFKKKYDSWKKNVVPFLRNERLKNFNFYTKNYMKIDQSKFEYLNIKKYFKQYKLSKMIANKFLNDYFKNELYKEIFYSALPPQIYATDAISMYHNLESRLPLLSKKLYKLSFSCPNDFLIRDGFNKAIFRKSLMNKVPSEVLNKREKVGFYKDIDEFFDFTDSKIIRFLLSNNFVNSFLNVKLFKKMLSKKRKNNQECHLIFSIINVVLYLKKYKRYALC